MKTLTEGALFAGVMGFGLGLRRAGFKNLWAVEREPFCQAVIRTQFPETEIFSDVREVGKRNLRAVDVVTAGFPCQDLSVAGKRAGLGGSRSGLFWEVIRILGELRPPWVLLENVPGLFSSAGGGDFATVIRELGNLGYGVAWRTLDSQYFGVAQRRRRVFIVGCFGKPCPAEVLFECEGGAGDFAEGGEAGAGIAGETCRSVADSVSASYYKGPGFNGQDGNLVAAALSASNGHHGHSSPRGDGSDNLVCGALDSFSGGPDDNSSQQQHIVAFAQNQRGELRTSAIMPQLTTGGGKPGEGYPAVAFEDARGLRGRREGAADLGGQEPDAGAGERPGAAVAFGWNKSASQHVRVDEQTDALQASESSNPAALCEAPDSDGVRDFAGLPLGLDSARYRALGNAVTAKVSEWIGKRIVAAAQHGA